VAWLYLILAGLLEIAWPIGFKYSDGFTKLLPTIPTMLALLLSFGLMSISARTLPIGTVYAVWTGIGVLGTTVCGILLFKESYDIFRVACIAVIFVGVVGLKFVTKA
jgi:quaternary ammonium compound-resistance protein SugE